MTFSLWAFLLMEIFSMCILYVNGMMSNLKKTLPLELGPSWFYRMIHDPRLEKNFYLIVKWRAYFEMIQSLSNLFS